MEQTPVYMVIVSDRTRQILAAHIRCLKRGGLFFSMIKLYLYFIFTNTKCVNKNRKESFIMGTENKNISVVHDRKKLKSKNKEVKNELRAKSDKAVLEKKDPQ